MTKAEMALTASVFWIANLIHDLIYQHAFGCFVDMGAAAVLFMLWRQWRKECQ